MEKLYKSLINHFQTIFQETIQKTPPEKNKIFVEHWSIWAKLWHWLYEMPPEKFFYSSLFHLRFLEIGKLLNWLLFTILSGEYRSSIREMRFFLESIIQAYYLDKKYPNSMLDCKINLLKELSDQKLYGTRLIDQTDLKEKQIFKNLYTKLSKFVHSTPEEFKDIEEAILEENERFRQRLFFYFDEKLFTQSIEFLNEFMDVFYYIFLQLFPEIIPKMKKHEITLNLLKKCKSETTLHLLKLKNLKKL
jgi:hypothetical protein